MQVLLSSPTIEEACVAFETLLAGSWYFSDDDDGSADVSYTVSDTLAEPIFQWVEQATASGLIEQAVILEPPQTDEICSYKGEPDAVRR
jgi:hypothetical protein